MARVTPAGRKFIITSMDDLARLPPRPDAADPGAASDAAASGNAARTPAPTTPGSRGSDTPANLDLTPYLPPADA